MTTKHKPPAPAPAPDRWMLKADVYLDGPGGKREYRKGTTVTADQLGAAFVRHHAHHAQIMVPVKG